MKKGNIIQLNTLPLNIVPLNGDEMPGAVVVGGGEIVPVPPTEPETPDVPVEPKKFILSASVTNGRVSASLGGKSISLPYTAKEGDVIVLEVEANDGYAFEGWADGVSDNPRTITMSADVALSAECVEVVAPSKYITFADAQVESILMSKGVSSDGVGITKEDAERVTSISTWFKGNTTITSFEEFAYFKNCTALIANAFDGCTSLAKLSLPTSLTSIDAYALRNVPAPMVLNAPNLATIGTASFNGSGLVEIKDLGKVSIIGSTSAVVQASSGVFANCKGLTKANISASVTHIGGMAFVGCTALTSVTGCEGVTNIVKQQAFDGCSALVGRMILPSIKVVDQYSFRNCKLEHVELGADCTTIAAYAFQNNSTLTAFVCRATTPPSLGNTNAFSSTNSCPIYVPDASVEAYKTATNWNAYASRIRPLSEIEGVVIEDGYELLQDGTIKQNANYFVVGFVPVNGGESITWGMPSGSGTVGYLVEYNAEGVKVDYWQGNANSRTITTKSSTKKIKACFLLSQKDSSYILDNTNGKYLWKGANVE